MWMGGRVPLGYDLRDRQLFVNLEEAKIIRQIFTEYLRLGCVSELKKYLDRNGIEGKIRVSREGHSSGGASLSRGALYSLLSNRLYRGQIEHRGQIHPGQHKAIVEADLWEKVAAQLMDNKRTRRSRGRNSSPSLLTGMLFDAQGYRYTPTHALKAGRRYRYYTSQAVIQRRETLPALRRLPAHEVEEAVLARLTAFLRSPREVMQLIEACTGSVVETNQLLAAAQLKSLQLNAASMQERETFLKVAIERIIVGEDSLDIRIGVGALTDLLLERSAGDSLPDAKAIRSQRNTVSVSLTCALQTKRQGRDLRLVLAANQQSVTRPSLPLIKAVVRANSWLERLLSGEILSLEELVSETGFTKRYVSRTLRGAFLAPDITEAILDGVQTPDLTVRSLMGGLPIDWTSQRAALKLP
jgi:site-specific DNA recombinase